MANQPVGANGARPHDQKHALTGGEPQSNTIHTVTKPALSWTILKLMSQMSSTTRTQDLGSQHAMAVIRTIDNRTFEGLIKTGPATARIKFSIRIKQGSLAADAVIATLLSVMQ